MTTLAKPHILLVDDEPNIRLFLGQMLQQRYQVTAVASAEEALNAARQASFDVAVLDLNLPGMDGLELLELIRTECPYLTVIMLTGYGTLQDAVHAMRHGAVNFLEKPATKNKVLNSIKEGLAKTRQEKQRDTMLLKAKKFFEAGLQELQEAAPTPVDLQADADIETEVLTDDTASNNSAAEDRFLEQGPLVIDTYRRQATLDDQLLELTAGEYDLLLCLVQHAPQVLDPQELVLRTRGYESTLTEAREIIRWQVYLLRQKIESDPTSPQYILNVRGRGYMWGIV